MRQVLYVTCNKCNGKRVQHLGRSQDLSTMCLLLRVDCHGETYRASIPEYEILDAKGDTMPGDFFTIHGIS